MMLLFSCSLEEERTNILRDCYCGPEVGDTGKTPCLLCIRSALFNHIISNSESGETFCVSVGYRYEAN